MRKRRVPWSHAPLIVGSQPLPAESAHYLLRVLRLSDGAQLVLFDGRGKRADATLRVDGESVSVDIGVPAVSQASRVAITIAAALPKGERADWLVEKATELGVDTIAWLRCARSVVEPKNVENKMGRWERVAESAARQCSRDTTPTLQAPMDLPEFLAEPTRDLKLVAHPYDAKPLHALTNAAASLDGVRVIIGPEGGLTEDELHAVKVAGYTAWSLNRHVLRTETAAVAAAALLSEVAQTREPG